MGKMTGEYSWSKAKDDNSLNAAKQTPKKQKKKAKQERQQQQTKVSQVWPKF